MNVVLQPRDLILAVVGEAIVLFKCGLNPGIPWASQVPDINRPKPIPYSYFHLLPPRTHYINEKRDGIFYKDLTEERDKAHFLVLVIIGQLLFLALGKLTHLSRHPSGHLVSGQGDKRKGKEAGQTEYNFQERSTSENKGVMIESKSLSSFII